MLSCLRTSSVTARPASGSVARPTRPAVALKAAFVAAPRRAAARAATGEGVERGECEKGRRLPAPPHTLARGECILRPVRPCRVGA